MASCENQFYHYRKSGSCWLVRKARELRSSVMKRNDWIVLILLAGVPQVIFAADHHLNEQQKLGWRLFEQSCGVCHTRPTLISGMYGPELSKVNLGGQEELLRTFISNGTARMQASSIPIVPSRSPPSP